MQHYFCDAWNTFDALIVVGSIVDIAITEVNVSTGVPRDAVPAPPLAAPASSAPLPAPDLHRVTLVCLHWFKEVIFLLLYFEFFYVMFLPFGTS